MKIDKIEAFQTSLPFDREYHMSKGGFKELKLVIVKVTTEDGTVGFGEAYRSGPWYKDETPEGIYFFIKEYVAPALTGKDIWEIEKIGETMDTVRIGNNYAKCAVEEAIFDALGKVAGVPVCKLLGGPIRQEVEIIGWVSLAEPQKMAEDAEKLVEEGYQTIKLKVGSGSDISKEVSRIYEVRKVLGENIKIRADANTNFTIQNALRFVKGIEALDLEFFEQP